MSQADLDRVQTSLPLRADPAAGALIGTLVLGASVAGPVGWLLALIAWAVMRRLETGERAHGRRAH